MSADAAAAIIADRPRGALSRNVTVRAIAAGTTSNASSLGCLCLARSLGRLCCVAVAVCVSFAGLGTASGVWTASMLVVPPAQLAASPPDVVARSVELILRGRDYDLARRGFINTIIIKVRCSQAHAADCSARSNATSARSWTRTFNARVRVNQPGTVADGGQAARVVGSRSAHTPSPHSRHPDALSPQSAQR